MCLVCVDGWANCRLGAFACVSVMDDRVMPLIKKRCRNVEILRYFNTIYVRARIPFAAVRFCKHSHQKCI